MRLEPVFSVSEFNQVVNNHLAMLGEVVVEGEISELKVSQDKWIYVTLKDERASVGVFGTVFQIKNLNALAVGMLVKVYGRPALYEKTGRFSLNAYQILPFGEGALKVAYEKLKRQLEEEGLFDPARKRPLPRFPERIGLITAKNSQAYNDFIKVTRERIGGVKILFYPVSVQGKEAVPSIKRAIEYFNGQKERVDVLVITRGGGSLEDLAAFNDEELTRAVFASAVPTVCAIGHEGDVSLAELAADLRASTPSNAAELVVRERNEIKKEIDFYIESMKSILERRIRDMMGKVERELFLMKQEVMTIVKRMELVVMEFGKQGERLKRRLELYEERVRGWQEKIRLLSPESALARGFSLTKNKQGEIVSSIEQVKMGESLVTMLVDGELGSIINKVEAKGEINDY